MEAERLVEGLARSCGVSGLLSVLREGGAGGRGAGAERVRAATERASARAQVGLPPPLHARLVQLWLRCETGGVGVRAWEALGAALVPERLVGDDALRLAVRQLQADAARPERISRSVFLLSWLHAFLEHDLLNVALLDAYYEFFVYLLNYEKFSPFASKFVYALTKPQDVTRGRVLNLLRISKSFKKSNCLYALIDLFKTYKPELVPENVPTIPTNSAFPKVNKLFVDNFQLAQARRSIQNELASESRLTWWKPTRADKKRQELSLIPNVDYIQLGSTLYSDYLNKKKCMEFDSVENLLIYDLSNSIDTPANILSLLVNDAGLHMIMNADENLQSRFSHVLYQTLYNNFIESSKASHSQKKVFLRRIITLQKYIMQGIPVVSRFLALYVSTWDGDEFFSEILELLEWITFDSFAELYDCILEPIETLYLTNNNYYCCSIVDMLKRMYVRLHYNMISNDKQFFLRRKKTYDDVEILSDLTDFMSDLCERSAHEVYASALLRNAYLDTYSTIAKLQLKCPNPLWSIAPKSLIYGSLCSPSAFGINRMLGLIINYHSLYEKIKGTVQRDEMNDRISLMEFYCTDITNSLCLGESLKFQKQGLLLETMPGGMFRFIPDKEECNKLLHFKYHIAFAAYTYMQKEIENIDTPDIIPPIFTNIVQYVETIFQNQSQSMIE